MIHYKPNWQPWQKRIAFVTYRVATVLSFVFVALLIVFAAWLALVIP
jgi:hypothetical protein